MQVIILAGGQGSRMDSDSPKPLVPINGKTILDYQLQYFFQSSFITKIILSLGHRAEEIKTYVTSHYADQPIEFIIEEKSLGTAGALKLALSAVTEEFVLVTNCDDITDIDLNKLTELKENTICVAHPQLPFGLVEEKDGYAQFREKPILPAWVSCGWYFLNKEQIRQVIPTEGSLEYDVWPKIKLKLYKHLGFWQPLNTPKDINEFQRKLNNH